MIDRPFRVGRVPRETSASSSPRLMQSRIRAGEPVREREERSSEGDGFDAEEDSGGEGRE